jgi:hypothetical protein
MMLRKYLERSIRGWLPKEPASVTSERTKMAEMKIRTKTETEAKAFKIASVANAIMVGAFLGTHLLINPNNSNIEASITLWSIFVPSLILVNVLLYRYFKKQAQPDGRIKT